MCVYCVLFIKYFWCIQPHGNNNQLFWVVPPMHRTEQLPSHNVERNYYMEKINDKHKETYNNVTRLFIINIQHRQFVLCCLVFHCIQQASFHLTMTIKTHKNWTAQFAYIQIYVMDFHYTIVFSLQEKAPLPRNESSHTEYIWSSITSIYYVINI